MTRQPAWTLRNSISRLPGSAAELAFTVHNRRSISFALSSVRLARRAHQRCAPKDLGLDQPWSSASKHAAHDWLASLSLDTGARLCPMTKQGQILGWYRHCGSRTHRRRSCCTATIFDWKFFSSLLWIVWITCTFDVMPNWLPPLRIWHEEECFKRSSRGWPGHIKYLTILYCRLALYNLPVAHYAQAVFVIHRTLWVLLSIYPRWCWIKSQQKRQSLENYKQMLQHYTKIKLQGMWVSLLLSSIRRQP